MRNPGGYAVTTSPDGMEECDTFTCFHCSKIVYVPPKTKIEEVGDFCRVCMKMVCAGCAGKVCLPWVEKINRMERRYHARRQFEKLAGL